MFTKGLGFKITWKPSYIFDLLQSVISLSSQTVEIVEGLPVGKF